VICDGKENERSDSDGLRDEGEGLRRGSRHGGNEASRKTTDKRGIREKKGWRFEYEWSGSEIGKEEGEDKIRPAMG